MQALVMANGDPVSFAVLHMQYQPGQQLKSVRTCIPTSELPAGRLADFEAFSRLRLGTAAGLFEALAVDSEDPS